MENKETLTVERVAQLAPETFNKNVFRLSGADVVAVLEERGTLKDLTLPDVVRIVNHAAQYFRIEEWSEYLHTFFDDLEDELKP